MDAKEFKECLTSEKGIVKIFHEYYPKLVINALKYFGCRSLAEDIAQEVIVKLLERVGDEIKKPDVYLSILVKHISLNKKKKDKKMEFSSELVIETEVKDVLNDEIKKWDFQKIFDSLSSESKKIYQMFYIDDISIKTIANELNSKEGTIKWKLHKLREEVKKNLIHYS